MNIPKYIHLYRKELTLKNYSENTINNYCCQVELFLKKHECQFSEPSKINETTIKSYLLDFKTRNAMCHAISSIKLFYKTTIQQPLKFKHIEYPRSEKKLPRVIDKEYLLDCISKIKNLKHKLIITMAFSTGMRVSEVCNLQIKDVDFERKVIYIKNAKGRKDRLVPLSDNVSVLMVKYLSVYKPNIYVFNGQFDLKYSHRSCNEIVKKYIGQDYHFHLLRHSSFTSLLESGTDLRIIQKLAGHASSRTTEIYTNVSNQLLSKINLPC